MCRLQRPIRPIQERLSHASSASDSLACTEFGVPLREDSTLCIMVLSFDSTQALRRMKLSKGERSEPLRYLHDESCRSGAISSQMAAPGRPILTGCAEGMGEMALAKEFF